MTQRRSLIIGVATLIVALGAIAVFWFWNKNQQALPSEESHGLVRVQPVSSKIDVSPDDFVTAVFIVKNLSGEQHLYQIQIVAPQGWEVLNPSSTLTLVGQSQQELFLTMRVPTAAPAGEYTLTVSARNQSMSALGRTQMRVPSIEVFKLSIPTWQPFIKMGEEGAYPITITNRGNLSATVRLAVTAPLNWQTRLPLDTLTLPPGQSQVVELVIRPSGQSSASQGKISIQATSGKRQEQVSFTVVVSAP
jgi:uncharacterized membrane protein